MSKNKDFHDFKVRDIPQKDWDLFMQHCREESLKRGKTISANRGSGRVAVTSRHKGATHDWEYIVR